MGTDPESTSAGKRRIPFAAIVLILISCYLTFETTGYLISVFRFFGGVWDLPSILLLNFQTSPTVILPMLIVWVWHKKRPELYRRILAWLLRVFYVVLIMALCDAYAVTEWGKAIFAFQTSASKNGDRVFTGPGYYIFSHYGFGEARPGLTIEIWHAPFEIEMRTKRPLIHWGWSHFPDD